MEFKGYMIEDNYWKGHKIITFQQMAKLLDTDSTTVASVFNRTIRSSKLIEGKDYFALNIHECKVLNGIDQDHQYPRGMKVITESAFDKVHANVNRCIETRAKKKAEEEAKKEQLEIIDMESVDDDLNPIMETKEEEKEKEVFKKMEEVKTPKLETEKFIIPQPADADATVKEMCQLMSKFMDTCTILIQEQSKNNMELCELVKELALARHTEVVEPTVTDEAPVYYDTMPNDYSAWKREINNAVDMIVDVTNLERNQILSDCYKLLTAEYGQVWDQCKKEFYKSEHRYSNSTMELEYWVEKNHPTYRHLMLAKLNTMYNEALKERNADA